MEKEQQLQENQYTFPYHHLARASNGNFSQVKELGWGYEYIAYLHFVLDYIKKESFNTLLDVGCGDGKFLAEAQKYFPEKKLAGVDYSKQAVGFAKAFNPNIDITAGDITDPQTLPGSFDVITLIEVLEHIPPHEISAFLKALRDRMDKNSICVITVPSTNTPTQSKHYQHFSIETLKETIRPHLTIVDYSFVNALGFRHYFTRFLLTNRFFILNWRRLINLIYKSYCKKSLRANEKNGKRIVAVCKI